MQTWISARYEDGRLAVALRASDAYGPEGQTTTAEVAIPADDPDVKRLLAALKAIEKRHAADLEGAVRLAQARALVAAHDGPKVAAGGRLGK